MTRVLSRKFILGEKSGVQIHFGVEARKIRGLFLISTMAIFGVGGGEDQGFRGKLPPLPPVDRTLAESCTACSMHYNYR